MVHPRTIPSEMSEKAQRLWDEFHLDGNVDEFKVYDYDSIITVHFNGKFSGPKRVDGLETSAFASIEDEDSDYGARIIFDISE